MGKTAKSSGEKIFKDIKRAIRKHYSSEEKIRIVLDGLRGEDSIAERWSRRFGPIVKVDRMTKEVLQNEETKEPFARV